MRDVIFRFCLSFCDEVEYVYHKSSGIAMSLTEIIASKIKQSGPVSFREYMATALYHPEHGYYTQSSFPAGGNADFVTSPHACRLFGAILANQVVQFRNFLNTSPEYPFIIVEMGAGTGYLACDLIRYLNEEYSSSFGQYRYIIVEPCSSTRRIQKSTLGNYDKFVSWVDSLENLPDFTGCMLSNELLDSFPVHVIQKDKGCWSELYVDYTPENQFTEVLRPLENPFLKEYVVMLPDDIPQPYRTEVNPDIKKWVQGVSSKMDQGFLLTIDYGYTWNEYFAPHRNRGTVLGYHAQRVVDNVLQMPGHIDITAHVNFSDLVRWGSEVGFSPIGYAPQYAFLGGLDFENTFKKIYGEINPFSPEMAAVKMLIMPQGMGESHKVLVQSKGFSSNNFKLSGFSFANHVKSLLTD